MKRGSVVIDTFYATLDRMEIEAAEVGLSLSELAVLAGVSRNTVPRWRRSPPETIRTLVRLEHAIIDAPPYVPPERPNLALSPRQLLDRAARGALRSMAVRRQPATAWVEVLGYTSEQLRAHLERQFGTAFSWQNVERWVIDHIVPLKSFEYETARDEGFKAAWAITNLRPLCRYANAVKGARREHLI